MRNWQKNRNFKERKNPDGAVAFIITVDGGDVEVGEEVYKAYASGWWKTENTEQGFKRDRVVQDSNGRAIRDTKGQALILPEREVSLEALMADDWDFPAEEPSPEDEVLRRMEYDDLRRRLNMLRPDERTLIDALFFEEMTEREYAELSGIPQKTINDRKARILARIKKLLTE